MTARHVDASDRVAPSDAEVIASVRSGNHEAYGLLFERHQAAAHRLARQLVRSGDSDDLVAESFARVLTVLQNGKGPHESFRAYLLTAMRRLHIDRGKAAQRERPTDDEAELDRLVEWVDPAQMRFEHGAAATAFAALPERWQMVLWHLDVEGQKPAEIAPLLGMNANSVSALAYRAREGLRQAYLQGHLAADQQVSCRDVIALLGGYVRGGLSSRDTAKVETHVAACARCAELVEELREVNKNLSALLGPALLGAAAAGYLGAGHGIGATLAGLIAAAKAGAAGAAEAALAPFKLAGATLAATGAQGAVAAVAVVAVGAGVVAVGSGLTDDPVAASATRAPTTSEPTIAAPLVDPTPAPTPSTPTSPTAAPTPTMPVGTMPAAPVVDAPATPAPPTAPVPSAKPPTAPAPTVTTTVPTVLPTPDPTLEPTPTPTPEPTATTPSPASGPADFGVASVDIVDQSAWLQRELTANLTVEGGDESVSKKVSVRFAFDHLLDYDGVTTDGWTCDADAGDRIGVVECSRTLPTDKDASVAIRVSGPTPSGSVTVDAPDDPHSSNDRREFAAPLWRGR